MHKTIIQQQDGQKCNVRCIALFGMSVGATNKC